MWSCWKKPVATPRPAEAPENVKTLLARARELEVRHKPPPPILQGRHLLALGVAPGPRMGHMLDNAYEAQLEGALRWAEKEVKTKG